jgi:activator of HSP90 ATPase
MKHAIEDLVDGIPASRTSTIACASRATSGREAESGQSASIVAVRSVAVGSNELRTDELGHDRQHGSSSSSGNESGSRARKES